MLRILKSSLPFNNACYLLVILIFHSFHSHYLWIRIETATIYHPSLKKKNPSATTETDTIDISILTFSYSDQKKQINKHWSVQCQQLREIPHH